MNYINLAIVEKDNEIAPFSRRKVFLPAFRTCSSPEETRFGSPLSICTSPMSERTPIQYFERTPSQYFFPSQCAAIFQALNLPTIDAIKDFYTPQHDPCQENSEIEQEEETSAKPIAEEVTLMLQNIPNFLMRDDIVEEMEKFDLMKEINFLYLPGETRNKRNVGYCFVNVTSSAGVNLFRELFEAAKLGNTERSCLVAVAKVQGLQANIDAYTASSVKVELLYQPILVENGEALPLEFETSSTRAIDFESSPTLMLRNIPNKYTQDMLIEEMRIRGVLSDIDFFYVPIDLRRQQCVGYCFVNLTSPEGHARFLRAFDRVVLDGVENVKTCFIVPGKIQGLKANIDRYRNDAVMLLEKKFQPLLFRNGEVLPFPALNMHLLEMLQMKKVKGTTSSEARVSSDPRRREKRMRFML